MGLVAKKTGEDFDPMPEGVHHAVCYAVYDIGTQHSEMYGVDKEQVLIMWEFPKERMEDGRPFSISRRYTNSLNTRASLRKDLEAWRGRAFTDEELENGFDLTKLLGANGQIQIIHNKKDDKTYANISSIMSLSKGMAKLKPENPAVFYDISMDIPETTPDWIKELIGKSKEKSDDPTQGADYVPPGEPPEEVSDVEVF
jgi:hypothetical protein